MSTDPVALLGEAMEAYLDAEEARARWEGYGAFRERHRRLPRPLRLLWWRLAHDRWLRRYMPVWRRAWREESGLGLLATGSGLALCGAAATQEAYSAGLQSLVVFVPRNFKILVAATSRLLDPNDDLAAEATRKVVLI